MLLVEDNKKVPSQYFLSMVIILLRKCQSETDMSLVEFLEDFEKEHPEFNPKDDVDAYDDRSLRRAISKYLRKMYPPKEQPKLNVEDLKADDVEDIAEMFDGPSIPDDQDPNPPQIQPMENQ
jgi:hypothetical protein